MAGKVFHENIRLDKAGMLVSEDFSLTVKVSYILSFPWRVKAGQSYRSL
jgi:hypothetical protein